MEKRRFIWIISAGVGSRDYLTYKAYETASRMDLLLGSKRFKELFEHKNYIVLKDFYTELDNIILSNTNKKIGIVVSGDAGFFSLANIIYKRYGQYIKETIPGISSFQLAFAKIPEGYEDAVFYSLHSKKQSLDSIDFQSNDKIVILLGEYSAKDLLNAKPALIKEFDIFVGCNLSFQDEHFFLLSDIDSIPSKNNLCLLILKRKQYV